MKQFYLACIRSAYGKICIAWSYAGKAPVIERILLPGENESTVDATQDQLKGAEERSCSEIDAVADSINRMFLGEAVKFDLRAVNLDTCSPFQKAVLLADYAIPRGWISTYGRIAQYTGKPQGARAVGNALAKNPFPLVIPCHRVVRADGRLGGFRGGIEMKRTLLSLEGVEPDENNRVSLNRLYY
jgi:methylated-DNA-[protein]-cysteine S-methyltransferase